jgi:hypothetical protein
MKLIVDGQKGVIAIAVSTDSDGDVIITANGITILWLDKEDGTVNPYSYSASDREYKELTKMGFAMSDGHVMAKF